MMKELYISPELEILCFAPVEELANYNQYNVYDARATDSGLSTGENVPGDVVDPEPDIDPLG